MAIQISISNAIGSRYRGSVVPPVDPDAQAFITAASITDPTQQAAINTLVVDLKGYNVWTKMKAVYPFVGGTATTHKFNLKNPLDTDAAFRLVFNGGWTHSSTGALPNGTNAFADSFVNVGTHLALNSTHVSVYSRTNVDRLAPSISNVIGSVPDEVSMFLKTGNIFVLRVNSSQTMQPTNLDSRGFFIGNRANATQITLSIRGTQTTTANNSISVSTTSLKLGGISPFFDNKQIAFSSIGDGLTPTELTNFYTAVQAFQTTLGRSIGTQTVSDADAQAFINAAAIDDQVEANAINNLVIGMKADGLWTKMKAVYPMVGGTNSQHTWNLKNTAQYQISWQGGVTSSNNGVQFGGVNGYGITGIIPSSVSTLNSTHMSFYSRTTLASSGVDDFGASVNVNQIQRLIIKNTNLNDHYVDMNSTSQRITGTVTVPSGLFLANRETSTALRSLRNNVSLGTNTNTNTGTLPNIGMFLGALNNAGSAVNYSVRECAFASYGDGLTTTDQTNLYTRVTTFQTALNRNV